MNGRKYKSMVDVKLFLAIQITGHELLLTQSRRTCQVLQFEYHLLPDF